MLVESIPEPKWWTNLTLSYKENLNKIICLHDDFSVELLQTICSQTSLPENDVIELLEWRFQKCWEPVILSHLTLMFG